MKPCNQNDRDPAWAERLARYAERPRPGRRDWFVLAAVGFTIVTAGYALATAAGYLVAHLGWVFLVAPVAWAIAVTLILVTMDGVSERDRTGVISPTSGPGRCGGPGRAS